jgi:hypothetical protein
MLFILGFTVSRYKMKLRAKQISIMGFKCQWLYLQQSSINEYKEILEHYRTDGRILG